jgi:hypothetical protein
MNFINHKFSNLFSGACRLQLRKGYYLLLVILLSDCINTFSQNSDTKFSMPLADVVEEIKSRYGISLRDPDHMIKDQVLTYALWRFRPDVDETLRNVFSAVDLSFQKEGDKKYKIQRFQYHRLSLKEGKEKLAYLSSLYDNKTSWEARKTGLKKCITDALEINCLPKKLASPPVVSNKRKMKGYTVENVAFETLPGLYACASVYKPSKIKGKAPVILCPNGHFGGGRYRPDQQKRCAALAKMGAITVSYDLFAWGESLLQFNPEDHHRSLAMTIQALNTIRILDYLLSLPDADTDRVAITGGSGGGSHTMLISAIDDRIKVSVPVVMLSCIHYGGCACESGMPVHLCGQGTNNVEIAGMFAPKPLLVISDGGDWTANVPEVEFPFLQRIYSFYNQEDQVKNKHFPNEGHDYSHSKRFPMYAFMAKYLGLNLKAIQNKSGDIDESFVTIEEEKAMYSFGVHGELLPENAIKDFKKLERLFQEYQTKNEE